MFNHSHLFQGALFIATLLHFNSAWSEADMPGSNDHPKIPRVAGTTIAGFTEINYDEGIFMTGTSGRKLLSQNVEGKRTRILYMGPEDLSTLAVLRNYQKAFDDLGEVDEVYSCKGNDCFANLGEILTWRESNRIPNIVQRSEMLYTFGYKDQIYC